MFQKLNDGNGSPSTNDLPSDNNAASSANDNQDNNSQTGNQGITLPKGGGAISGMGEKFQANPVTGTGSFSVPVAITPGRNGFTPQLALAYDSGQGNTPFGLGWSMGVPSISRKTQKGLPTYQDDTDEDIFLLSGFEDLVPMLKKNASAWEKVVRTENDTEIKSYRPRTEGTFAKIEKHRSLLDGSSFWKVVTGDNITTIYGDSTTCRIAHPEDITKISQWFISHSYDEKGNVIQYQYKRENAQNISNKHSERNRLRSGNAFNQLYLKSINYTPDVPFDPNNEQYFDEVSWHFKLVMDYGEHDEQQPEMRETSHWPVRQDPYSSYRSGFEIRTYRLCRRVLMFHCFEQDLGVEPYLVKSTDITYDENPVASRITAIQQVCYEAEKSPEKYPPVSFQYSEATVSEAVLSLPTEDLDNLPGGVGGLQYQWSDLQGEGLPGVLIEDQNAWYFKRNLGDDNYHQHVPANENPAPVARMGALRQILHKPQPGLQQNARISDLDANGTQDLVITSESLAGYFSQNQDGEWQNFQPFSNG
ncbi:MAG: SpvB/TcaC N-terminal domain-containing protein [Bacteroidota bacterium]